MAFQKETIRVSDIAGGITSNMFYFLRCPFCDSENIYEDEDNMYEDDKVSIRIFRCSDCGAEGEVRYCVEDEMHWRLDDYIK